MKRILFYILSSFIPFLINAQVKIGNNPAVINSNSLLELESTNKGLLLPRLDNSQMTGMISPPKGMIVFNTTDSSIYIRRVAGWSIISTGAPAVWGVNGNNIYNTNTDYIGINTPNPGCKLDLRNVPIGFSSESKRWEMAYDSANAYFYIDEYGSARRFVIADGGYVGIGTTQPFFDLHINNPNTTAAIKFTNSISGNAPEHGADLGEFGHNFSINNWENGSIFFSTNHLQRAAIDPAGNVGIGTISPAAKLDVNGSANINGAVKITDGTQGDGRVLTSDGNGNASWKDAPGKQVAFGARLYATNFTFDGQLVRIPFDSVYLNNGNGYDAATHIFTAPTAGLYQFYLNIQWASSFTGFGPLFIRKLTAPSFYQNSALIDPVFNSTESVAAIYYLNIGDQIDFCISETGTGSQTIFALNATYVYGYKVY